MAQLEAVPDPDSTPQRRGKPSTTVTSFRISTHWFDKVKAEAEKNNTSASQIYHRALAEYFGQKISNESWEVADDDFYDPNEFYTASQDKKGHSFHMRVNLPKPLGGQLYALIQSAVVPQYRSVEDIARDAVYHRVKQIARAIDDGELEAVVDMAMLHAQELQITETAQHADELIDAMQANAAMMWQRNDAKALKKFLAERRSVADSLVEPYRTDYLAVIKNYEGRLAKEEKRKSRKKK